MGPGLTAARVVRVMGLARTAIRLSRASPATAQVMSPATPAVAARRRGRSWGSVGNEVASHTWRATEKAAEGLGRWATTDHSGLGQRLSNMPPGMSVMESIGYALAHFAISIVFAALQPPAALPDESNPKLSHSADPAAVDDLLQICAKTPRQTG